MTNRKLNFLAPGVLIVPVSSDDLVIMLLVFKTFIYVGIVKITWTSNVSVKIAFPLHLCLVIF